MMRTAFLALLCSACLLQHHLPVGGIHQFIVGAEASVVTDYASAYLGAKVVEHHEKASRVHTLLHHDAQKYMLVPCNARRLRFTIQLAREASVRHVTLQNLEYFASSLKHFTLLGSRTFPCLPPDCMWRVMGSFKANYTRSPQHFVPTTAAPVRFIRLLWQSHHGQEKTCTMTYFHVFGVDAWEQIATEIDRTKQMHDADVAAATDDEDDDMDDGTVDEPPLAAPATDTQAHSHVNTTSLMSNVSNAGSGAVAVDSAGRPHSLASGAHPNGTSGNGTSSAAANASGIATSKGELRGKPVTAARHRQYIDWHSLPWWRKGRRNVSCPASGRALEEYFEVGGGASCPAPSPLLAPLTSKPSSQPAASQAQAGSVHPLLVLAGERQVSGLKKEVAALKARLAKLTKVAEEKATTTRLNELRTEVFGLQLRVARIENVVTHEMHGHIESTKVELRHLVVVGSVSAAAIAVVLTLFLFSNASLGEVSRSTGRRPADAASPLVGSTQRFPSGSPERGAQPERYTPPPVSSTIAPQRGTALAAADGVASSEGDVALSAVRLHQSAGTAEAPPRPTPNGSMGHGLMPDGYVGQAMVATDGSLMFSPGALHLTPEREGVLGMTPHSLPPQHTPQSGHSQDAPQPQSQPQVQSHPTAAPFVAARADSRLST